MSSFFEFVLANPEKPWEWSGLSYNPNITWEIVQDNPDKPWDWKGLSRHPNITWEIIQDNPDKPWDFTDMSWNTFGADIICNKQRILERTAVYKKELMEAVWSPNRLQRLLEKGYDLKDVLDLE